MAALQICPKNGMNSNSDSRKNLKIIIPEEEKKSIKFRH